MNEITPERLAKIEAIIKAQARSYHVSWAMDLAAEVPDLCAALRQAWAERAERERGWDEYEEEES